MWATAFQASWISSHLSGGSMSMESKILLTAYLVVYSQRMTSGGMIRQGFASRSWTGPINLSFFLMSQSEEEKRELCCLIVVRHRNPILPYDRFSSFIHLKRVIAWVLRFTNNCKKRRNKITLPLTVSELASAESYWISLAQQDYFSGELRELKAVWNHQSYEFPSYTPPVLAPVS